MRLATPLCRSPELIRQNELLRQSNEVYRLRAMQADAVFRENEHLRQLLAWRQGMPQSLWKLKLARVVTRDPANWWHTLQIDLGSRDGMQTNLTVLVPEGLVGRISAVGLTTSQVVLVGSPNCKVAAVVASDKTGELGVITGGATPLDSSLVTLSYLSSTSNLKPGQTVRTSGEGGLTRGGIVIGQVAEIRISGGAWLRGGSRQTGGESEFVGGSVGADAMNLLNSMPHPPGVAHQRLSRMHVQWFPPLVRSAT